MAKPVLKHSGVAGLTRSADAMLDHIIRNNRHDLQYHT